MVIKEIVTGKERARFIKFPWQIYRSDSNWVPPLILERNDFLTPHKNPFFDHAEVKLFMACDDTGHALGRIAGIIDHNYIATHKEDTGFFGLFECVADQEVAGRLFDEVAQFLKSRGIAIMRGPENLSVNHDIGLLVEGFTVPPMFMMPYNLKYYEQLILGYGFVKAMDLYAYYGEHNHGPIPNRIERGAQLCQKKYKFKVRPLNMKDFATEAKRIQAVYTAAWENNWGAVPMTEKEFTHLARNLKLIIDPDLCLIAEVGNEVAGFSLAVPDFNQVLRRLNGRLLPFGLFKLLWYKQKINGMRMIAMGIKKEFRHMGIDNYFYYETYQRGPANGYTRCEMSWVLENNTAMNRALEKIGYTRYKTYRLYDFNLQ
jgi:ribosomal protein S18 acetylase RimI-like enzyme